MAGNKVEFRESEFKDGFHISGLPMVVITENGNVEPDDEWALFRLTDDGLEWYHYGAEFRADIMGLEIRGQRAVEERFPHYKTEEEAIEAKSQLSLEERKRTIIRSVKPKR